jgi:hypothetical protein
LKLAIDNSERIEHLRSILKLAFWTGAASPMPQDILDLVAKFNEIDPVVLREDTVEAAKLLLADEKRAALQLV